MGQAGGKWILDRVRLLFRASPYLLLLVIAFLSSFRFRRAFFATDEGLYYYEAIRMLHGDAIYRDFFEFVTPGVFLYIGWIMRLFGEQIMPVRYSLGVMYVLETWIVYWLGRRLGLSRWVAFLPPLIFIVDAKCESWWSIQHHSISHFLAMASTYLLVRWADERKGWQVLCVGLLAGATVCVTQHLGLTVISIALFWAVIWQRFWLRRPVGRAGMLLLGGACAPMLATVAYLTSKGALMDAYRCTIQWVFSSYRGYHAEPYFSEGIRQIAQVWAGLHGVSAVPQLLHLLLMGYLPLVALAGGSVVFAIGAIRSRANPSAHLPLMRFGIVLSAAGGLFSQVAAQPTVWSIKQNSTLAYTVALFLLISASRFLPSLRSRLWVERSRDGQSEIAIEFRSRVPTSPLRLAAGIASIALIAAAYYVYVPGLMTAARAARLNRNYILTPFGALWSNKDHFVSDLESVRAYVDSHVAADRQIYGYYWSPYLYMVLGRAPCVPFHGTLPGYHTEEQVSQIVEAIRGRRPAVIVQDRMLEWMIATPDPRIVEYGIGRLPQEPIACAVMSAYVPVMRLTHFTLLVPRRSP